MYFINVLFVRQNRHVLVGVLALFSPDGDDGLDLLTDGDDGLTIGELLLDC